MEAPPLHRVRLPDGAAGRRGDRRVSRRRGADPVRGGGLRARAGHVRGPDRRGRSLLLRGAAASGADDPAPQLPVPRRSDRGQGVRRGRGHPGGPARAIATPQRSGSRRRSRRASGVAGASASPGPSRSPARASPRPMPPSASPGASATGRGPARRELLRHVPPGHRAGRAHGRSRKAARPRSVACTAWHRGHPGDLRPVSQRHRRRWRLLRRSRAACPPADRDLRRGPLPRACTGRRTSEIVGPARLLDGRTGGTWSRATSGCR